MYDNSLYKGDELNNFLPQKESFQQSQSIKQYQKEKYGSQNKKKYGKPKNPPSEETKNEEYEYEDRKKSNNQKKEKKFQEKNYSQPALKSKYYGYGNKEPFYVLMVAEKPSIATSITEALSSHNGYSTKKSFFEQ